ncbi:MAG: hypothetical protein GY708_27010 [Actinomycetia bacterium]|nr:hypothetical protein [Actinomycetes bacterium]MCP4962682.1 hypothetical protein [Actinomycetes bacterium]
MDNTGGIVKRREGEKTKRRRAAVLGVVVGVALLGLALGIFSVGRSARRVTERAGAAHAYDELLMTATVVRAQVGFTVLVADLGETAGIDVSGPVSSNQDDISASLTSMTRIVEETTRDFGGLGPATIDAVERFREEVKSITLALGDNKSAIADTLELEYSFLTDVVAEDRDAALQLLIEADDELSNLGTAVGAAVAFLLPAIAVILYRQLTAPSREVIALESSLAKEHTQSMVRRLLVSRFVERVRRRPSSHLTDQIERYVTSTEIVDGTTEPNLCEISSGDLSRFLWRSARLADIEVEVDGPASIAILADTSLSFDAMRLVMRDMKSGGASVARCEIVAFHDSVELRIDHDGVGRSAREAELALSPLETDVVGRRGPTRTADLWVARTLLRAGGADIKGPSGSPTHTFALTFPRIAVDKSGQPDQALSAAHT